MRKLYTLGLALVAIVAFNVVAVASASALEWLKGAAKVEIEEAAKTSGKVVLHKEGGLGAAAVECEGEFKGTVEPGGKSKVTEVVKGTEKNTIICKGLSPGGGACEGLNPSVKAEHLPWLGQLEELTNTKGEKFVVNKATGTGGEPGYAVTCTIAITCTGTEFAFLRALNEEPAVFEFLHEEKAGQERESGLSTCGDGGRGWVTGSGTIEGFNVS